MSNIALFSPKGRQMGQVFVAGRKSKKLVPAAVVLRMEAKYTKALP